MKRKLMLVPGVLCLGVLCQASLAQFASPSLTPPAGYTLTKMDPNKLKSWYTAWSTNVIGEYSGYRTCDWAVGEDIAWIISPLMTAFDNGYTATGDANWVKREMNWADSLLKRALTEPDGYKGWPAYAAAGTDVDQLNSYYADSMLGDAMCMKPIVEIAGKILSTPALDAKYDANAKNYIAIATQMYSKWVSRGGFRNTTGGGAIDVVQPWGYVDPNRPALGWTSKYALRNDPNWGFSHPDNKNNEVAMWLLTMYDVTKDANYKTQASKWYTLQKSRMAKDYDGSYKIWDYWDPAGKWDYDPNNGATKHWQGVHPNPGYYVMDTSSIVDAYEHGIVFTKADIDALVKTNLKMIAADANRYWPALAPYNTTIQADLEAKCDPTSWGGYTEASWYMDIQVQYAPEPASLALLTGGAMTLLLRRRGRRGRRKNGTGSFFAV
jgi:hypothetical protein